MVFYDSVLTDRKGVRSVSS